MLTATVPVDGGAVPELDEESCTGIAGVLDAAGTGRTDLPCQLGNPDLWFGDTPAELEKAKKLCTDCPIRAECLASALSRGEPWGVWGGEIFERGTVIARKRPRGRPRKNQTRQEEFVA
ncbi:WhiB family transcriptional regulator [Sciscionella sediminilitoris]|uniref:WhiB family transcriptional regulator n=1 Tax=Sciscionella sediminilitoris TaxID=1445613 RepID=UPI0004DF5385|nr:WhiB family transcriptional regulator [Sciscionella sp. SE31]